MNFEDEVGARLVEQAKNSALKAAAKNFNLLATPPKYTYNFFWLGRPVIQYPQDLVAMQEIIWMTKPDLIIETGVAHGGSLVFYASMLELISSCCGTEGKVLGIDIDIRPHNRAEIEKHPLAKRINLIESSSTDAKAIRSASEYAKAASSVLVVLDSNHSHDHVLDELEAYSSFVTQGNYCVVFDTVIEELPPELIANRPWGPGNSPGTAVQSFLSDHPEFEVDHAIDSKLLVSMAPGGYLRRKA